MNEEKKWEKSSELTSSPNSGRVTGLDHKLFDYPVENIAIEVIIFSQTTEIFYCFWTLSWEQFAINIASVRMQSCGFKEFRCRWFIHDGNAILMRGFLIKDISVIKFNFSFNKIVARGRLIIIWIFKIFLEKKSRKRNVFHAV